MNTMRYVLAVAGKELQVLSTDRGGLAVLFILPILLSSMLGSVSSMFAGAAGETGEPSISLDVLLVNEDSGQYATQMVNILEDIDQLHIETVDSAATADAQMADGQALAAILIPADFSQRIDAYEPTRVQVIVDPSKEEAASIVSGIMNKVIDEVTLWGEVSYGIRSVFDESGVLEGAPAELRQAAEAQTLGAILTQVQSMRQSPLITVAGEDLEGVEESQDFNPFGFVVPNFTVMFAFFLIGVVATSVLKEKEEGSFRRLIAAPIPRGAIIAGKILAYSLVVILQVIVLFAISNAAFDMPLGESWTGLILLSVTLALTSSALGMLLATLAKTSSQAASTGTILGFILAGLGGCIVTFSPDSFMGKLSLITPHGHALRAFHRLLNEGVGLLDVLPQTGILFGFAAVFFLVTMWRFRFE